MRHTLSIALMLAPLPAIAGNQCTLPDAPASAKIPVTEPASPALSGAKAILPNEIGQSPALQRISSQGAQLYDIGLTHGLRGVFAAKGGTFQVFYIAPDNAAVVGGVMWDQTGHNVTRDQVSSIEGAIPTVTIGDVATAKPSSERPNSSPAANPSNALDAVVAGSFGSEAAPKLTMFIDPLCSFSVRALDQLQSYVASGRVQLEVVPISVLDYEDQGRSTLAAKAMLSLPAAEMVYAWSTNKLTGPASPVAAAKLAANMRAAEAIGLKGTPTLLWKTTSGQTGRADGLPGNLEAVIADLGK